MKYFGGTVEADDFEDAKAALRCRIGENLKTLRKMRGLSAADVADGVVGNMDAATVLNYEKGKGAMSLENAWRLADFYGVSLGALGGRIMYEPSLANESADSPTAKLAC